MTLPENSLAPYRFRIRRQTREPRRMREHARLWTAVGSDPRARLRCGSFSASDGAEIPYRLWPARNPAGAVLLLHGAFDYAAAFDEIGPKLARSGFTALAIDQRGFGATRSRGKWSGTARMTEDALEAGRFLLERGGSQIQFGGHRRESQRQKRKQGDCDGHRRAFHCSSVARKSSGE